MLKPRNVLLAIVFFFFIFFLRWNSLTTPFERDEGEYAYGAWVITQGGFPYKDTFLQKPPLIIYTYWLGEVLVGHNLWFPRLLAIMVTVITAFVLGKIAQERISQEAFWPVMFLFPLLVWSPINSGLAANTEIFMLLPLSILLWKKNPLLSGSMAALAILYKPICLYVVASVLLIRIINTDKRWGYLLKVGLSVLITVLMMMLPVIKANAWSDFWGQVVVFNALYAKQWGISLMPALANLKAMWPSFWVVFLLLVIGIFVLNKNRVWYLYLGLGLLAVFQTTIRHYYLLLIPFIALISISMLFSLPVKKHILVFCSGFLLLSILWPIRQQFSLTPAELSRWIYGDVNPFVESLKIAEELAKITNRHDCVFVAGSEPQILYYAKRISCTRFNITYPLIIDSAQREKYQNEIENDLKMKQPKAVVVSTLAHSGLWDENNKELLEFTKNMLVNYQPVIKLGGLVLYEQK